MKKDCHYKQELAAFADRELSARDTERISAHLNECEDCREELKRLRHTDRLLIELPAMPPSEDFDRSFWQKVDEIEEKKEDRLCSRLLVFGWRPYMAMASVGLLVIGLLNYYPFPFSVEPNPEARLIAENLELYENMEIIDKLDLLENWETIMSLLPEEGGYLPEKQV